MPNCFSLTRKSNPKFGPVNLKIVDEEMCKHFNVSYDEKIYHAYWFDHIGFYLAMGRSLDYIKGYYNGCADSLTGKEGKRMDHFVAIARWLDENFTANTWAER